MQNVVCFIGFVKINDQNEGQSSNCKHLGGGSVPGGVEACKKHCRNTATCNAFNYKDNVCYTKQCNDDGDPTLVTFAGGWNVWIDKELAGKYILY